MRLNTIITISVFLFGTLTAEAEPPYDFKGIPLGISLKKFRQIAQPDGNLSARVVCTGDTDNLGLEPYEVTISDEAERKAGIARCIFWGKLVADAFSEEVVPLNMGGGKYASWHYDFSFASASPTDAKKLYKIVLPTNLNAMSDVVDALADKFGVPTGERTDTVQNMMGATFPQKSYSWSTGGYSILVQGPWSKINDMIVVYTDDTLAAAIDKITGVAKASKPNRM